MKIIFLSFFVFFAFVLCASSDSTRVKKPGRFSIGISVSPDLCYRTIIDPHTSYSQGYVAYRNYWEIPKAGVTVGLHMTYTIKKWLEFQAGILYSDKGYQKKQDTSLVFYYSLDKFYTKDSYTFHYLDIPVRVNFLFGKKKVRFSAGIGLVANIYLTETTTYSEIHLNGNDVSKKIQHQTTNNPINISPFVALGIDCALSKRSRIRIEPDFSYGLLNTNNEQKQYGYRDSTVKELLWGASLNICYLLRL